MSLREEFEPLLISPHGLHSDAELARMGWDNEVAVATKHQPWPEWEAHLRDEIARADEWLRLCGRTIHVNTRCCTSYGLKHIAERWHVNSRGGNGYMSNGCFLMAASRLGFEMKGAWGNYCFGGRYVWDTFNAWINIRNQSWPPAKLRVSETMGGG